MFCLFSLVVDLVCCFSFAVGDPWVVLLFGKAAMSCTVKYHNSKNKDDQFSWDQTTTIEELKIMIITAHATMADGFRLCYCGKEVEDIRRVAEYLMVQDPKPFIAVVKLRGGMGKRAKMTVDDSAFVAKDSDHEAIKECLAFKVPGTFKKWVLSLDDGGLASLGALAKSYGSAPEKIAEYAASLVEPLIVAEAWNLKNQNQHN